MDNKTKDALAEVTKLSMVPTTPKNVVPILQTCIDVYNNILNSDQKSLEAISNHNLVQLSMELGANVENILGCDNAFKQAKLESPMKEIDAMLGKIISNTLTIGVDMFNDDSTMDHVAFSRQFEQICSTVGYVGVSEEAIKLLLISFALGSQIQEWLEALHLGTITTWEEFLQ
ncbi:hypothetical protein Golob_017082 [Gossypium lobatum]|uniref:Pectinesterase inhibitor domain-containing protein n=1 Tax=Gossypium lobatum TaxID=34289 RepID=A0A7J8M625_9ROSI|nr:hypothetical protein [Gossypium lobatum]